MKNFPLVLLTPCVLSVPLALAQPADNTPLPINPPALAIPLPDSGVTEVMHADMAALDRDMAKLLQQMATINATPDLQTRQRLIQELLPRMQQHLRGMQTLMGHLGDVQSSGPPANPPRAMPPH